MVGLINRFFALRQRAGAVLALLLLLGCGDVPEAPISRHPVMVVAVDGLEWSVLAPLVARGELPTLARWIENGQAGLLKSMRPTKSPVIWTTIATGKPPAEHGILDFIRPDTGAGPSLFTRLDRKVPALWNIASAAERESAVIGWWMTHPVEPIRGVMVAQTNTLPGAAGAGAGVWKGAPDLDQVDQIYPAQLRPMLADVIAGVDDGLDQRLTEIFGELDFSEAPMVGRMWTASRWSVRADAVYVEFMNRLLEPAEADYDLALLYLGGADVLGHRFWRYHRPEDFDHAPTSAEIERFGSVLNDYYRFLDAVFEGLEERTAGRWNIMVVSDHGMQAHHADSAFDEKEQLGKLTSGHHFQAPAGVVLATGPDFRRNPPAANTTPAGAVFSIETLRTLGGVYDVAPTVLALLGLPTAADMPGRPMEHLFSREFLARERPAETPSYGSGDATGPSVDAVPDDEETERLEQLRSLGYID